MTDIRALDDVKLLVDEFYGRVRKDEVLGPVFDRVIGDNWDQHLDKMYRFWQTILLDEGKTYFGNPFMKHSPLPLTPEHFTRWLSLWKTTLATLFKGDVADEALWRAEKMGYIFQIKMFGPENAGRKPIF